MGLRYLLVLLAFSGSALCGQELSLHLRRQLAGGQALSSSLVFGASKAQGRIELKGGYIEGVVEWNPQGSVQRYERSRWRPGRSAPDDRLLIEKVVGGYRVREESQLGSRTRLLKLSPVRLVVDIVWPEAMIPLLREVDGGHLRVLDVATWSADHVELLPRDGGARYLDLKGGGVTLELGPDKVFRRLLVPGDAAMEIIPEGASSPQASPPPGVIETAVNLPRPDSPKALMVLPAKKSQLPGVILIADAGVRDANGDGPVGGSAILRDLAWSLAKKGYASIRYEKRRKAPPPRSAQGFSALVSDAWAAGRLLAEHPEVDGSRLAAIGQGEGALVAARLGRTLDQIRAVVALAPPPEPLRTALVGRLDRRLRKAGESSERIEAQLKALEQELEQLAEADADKIDLFSDRVLHDLLLLDPARTLVDLGKPLLLLFGDTDHQVSERRRAMLRATLALGKRNGYEFQVMSQADHDFLHVSRVPRESGPSSPTDRARTRHPALVVFIDEFLQKQLSR